MWITRNEHRYKGIRGKKKRTKKNVREITHTPEIYARDFSPRAKKKKQETQKNKKELCEKDPPSPRKSGCAPRRLYGLSMNICEKKGGKNKKREWIVARCKCGGNQRGAKMRIDVRRKQLNQRRDVWRARDGLIKSP